MNILVTGGCGFIGTNFIQTVFENKNDHIVNLDKLTYAGNPRNLEQFANDNRYTFVHGDINDAALVATCLREYKIDQLVHFAAESHVDRSINDSSACVATNINGTHVLLEQARIYGLPLFVHVSTDEVYGTLGSTGYFTETTPLAPNSPYSASKAASDLLARAYFHTYNFPVITTRCSNNYGPYQFPEKLIPFMFERACKNEPLPIYGNGQNVRDWIYVRDHCLGILAAIEHGKAGEIYNFGGSAERTNLEVVREILAFLDKPESLVTFVQDRPGHDLRYAMDSGKAKRELGWKARMTFAQGLQSTLEWYQNNQGWLTNVKSGEYRNFIQQWYNNRKK